MRRRGLPLDAFRPHRLGRIGDRRFLWRKQNAQGDAKRIAPSIFRIGHVRKIERLASLRHRAPRIPQAGIVFALYGIVCFLGQRCAFRRRFPCDLALGSHVIVSISIISPPEALYCDRRGAAARVVSLTFLCGRKHRVLHGADMCHQGNPSCRGAAPAGYSALPENVAETTAGWPPIAVVSFVSTMELARIARLSFRSSPRLAQDAPTVKRSGRGTCFDTAGAAIVNGTRRQSQRQSFRRAYSQRGTRMKH